MIARFTFFYIQLCSLSMMSKLAHFVVFVFLFVHETQSAFLFQNNVYNENIDNDEMLSKMDDDQVIRVDDNETFDEQEVVNGFEKMIENEVVEVEEDLQEATDQIDYQTITTSNVNDLEPNDDDFYEEEVPQLESVRPNTSNLNDLIEEKDFIVQETVANEDIIDQETGEIDDIVIQEMMGGESILLNESVKLNENYEEEPQVDILVIDNDNEFIQEGVEEGEEEKEEEDEEVEEVEQEEISNEKKSIENIVKNCKVDEYDDNEDVIVSPQSELSAENNPRKTGENESTKDEVSV